MMMLDMGENIMQYMRAFYGFERSASAVNGRSKSARIDKGLVFRKAKVSYPKFRLSGQFNRTLFNSGFFAPIDAVLQTILSTVVGGVELTDVMQSCEGGGRGAKSQIAPDEWSKKGHPCKLQGLHGRAVADTDLSDRSMNRIAGIGYGTGMQVGDDPYPC